MVIDAVAVPQEESGANNDTAMDGDDGYVDLELLF